MGAETFINVVEGGSMKDAFLDAVQQAQWDYGHAGYTGTLAEKGGYTNLTHACPGKDRESRMKAINEGWDSPLWDLVRDKWGPAGAVELEPGVFCFFGWASS